MARAKKKERKAAATKTTYYGLRRWYFVNGKTVSKAFEVRRESEPLSYYVHCEEYDVYEEFFPTAEARAKAIEAGRTTAEEIEANGMGTCPIEGTAHTAVYYRKVIE